jgi:hypothetical protein
MTNEVIRKFLLLSIGDGRRIRRPMTSTLMTSTLATYFSTMMTEHADHGK